MSKVNPEEEARKALLDKLKVTEEQIKAWKAQYGAANINHLTIEHEGKIYDGLFRTPDFDVLIKAEKHIVQQEFYSAGLIYLDSCELAKDEAIESVDVVKAAFCMKLATLFKIKVAEVKNL